VPGGPYAAPGGMDVDKNGIDSPIDDDNKEDKISSFKNYIVEMASHYQGSHLLIPMGDDFRFEDAKINFDNIDRLIKEFNEPGIVLKYSTPSEFVRASHNEGLAWPVNYADMFPYADLPDAFWTGYFTSRPNSKAFIRKGSQNLHLQGLAFSALSLKKAFAGSEQEKAFNSI